MATDVNVQETWTMEPELAETPPRRIAPSGYPDLNKPNAILINGVGAVLMLSGIVLLALGLMRGAAAFTFFGIFLALVGMIIVVLLVPSLVRRHLARVEHLTVNGVPVMVRVLSADNMSGDNNYGRMVKYQVTMPTGELTYRTSHADDRLLPRKIPGNVTALLDINTGDVELYCALPFRAIPKPTGAVSSPSSFTLPGGVVNSAPATPAAPQTEMGTITIGSLPPRPVRPPVEMPPVAAAPQPPSRPEPKPEPTQQKQEQKQEQSSAPAGLPWE